ncbi:hypothetical protein QBC39DRAFT_358843 [Podospora conica]|nr:hypothetical protein QBC39DRAFT_358843 [Schizothecium conicum]
MVATRREMHPMIPIAGFSIGVGSAGGQLGGVHWGSGKRCHCPGCIMQQALAWHAVHATRGTQICQAPDARHATSTGQQKIAPTSSRLLFHLSSTSPSPHHNPNTRANQNHNLFDIQSAGTYPLQICIPSSFCRGSIARFPPSSCFGAVALVSCRLPWSAVARPSRVFPVDCLDWQLPVNRARSLDRDRTILMHPDADVAAQSQDPLSTTALHSIPFSHSRRMRGLRRHANPLQLWSRAHFPMHHPFQALARAGKATDCICHCR